MFVNSQHGIKRQGQDFDKKFALEGIHSKRLTDKFPEKSWTKRGVNKLFKKLRDTGTVNRRPGNDRPHSVRTEGNAKLLLQKFPQSATDFVLPTGEVTENTFLSVKKIKSVACCGNI